MSERIILIETSTALCSAAIMEDGEIVSSRESDAMRSHASLAALFVDEMLKERGLALKDCSAVCVSLGPGSYTGLRVGVSTAKGLCFGSGLPLLAVGTLDILAAQALDDASISGDCDYIIPMIDARRMEVYTAIYDREGKRLSEVEARIIDSESFSDLQGRKLFIGDGALKCEPVLQGDNRFVQCCPKAVGMKKIAREAFLRGDFRDVAYLEPFYLKEFVATVSKKKII